MRDGRKILVVLYFALRNLVLWRAKLCAVEELFIKVLGH